MEPFVLQKWTTIRGTGTTPVIQSADQWLDLAAWADTIRRLGESWRDTFVYFKHEESGTGPAFARRLTGLLAGDGGDEGSSRPP